ncbi:class I SAM-dependent DNA methyltransferase [Minwuia sp.]|uniref:class I SAM-dependent DNA methyltransferase n=1 Tax=Minwuia sp. TaxID=2493630 RepID=UPI003A9555F2
MSHLADEVIGIYRRRADTFDRLRNRSLFEKVWLDRFLAELPSNRPHVLDLGCGMGEPIACYLIEHGCRITGVDTSSGLLDMARQRFPAQDWREGDMRTLNLAQTFDGIIAFGSLFLLRHDDQRSMFPIFRRHAHAGTALLMATGPEAGETAGAMEDERIYAASLSPAEYARLLEDNGFLLRRYVAEDPECDQHSIWLAKSRAGS